MSQRESVERMKAVMRESPDWEYDSWNDTWRHQPSNHDFMYWLFDAHLMEEPEAVWIETSVCVRGLYDSVAAEFVQALVAMADQARTTLMGAVKQNDVGWWVKLCPTMEVSAIYRNVLTRHTHRLVYRPKESEG